MSGKDDGHVFDLSEKFSIKDLMHESKTPGDRRTASAEATETKPEAVPAFENLAPLPKPGDAYKAYSRPANQMLPTLHLLSGDGQVWSYPYSCLVEGPHMLFLPDNPGKGAVIVMRFAASVSVEVVMTGLRLDELHNYLGDHRVRWVRELSNGKLMGDNTLPVVKSIVVRPVAAEMEKGWPIAEGPGATAKRG